MPLRVTLLGTGTSHGVPMIACDCPVCRSSNPRNRRHRTGAYLELPGGSVLIDTPPELRLQALAFEIRRVDAVLMTHAHADHIAGFDDLRRFNELAGGSIPVYGHEETMAEIRWRWSYIFDPTTQPGGGKPEVTLVPVRGPFELLRETIVPVPSRPAARPRLQGTRLRLPDGLQRPAAGVERTLARLGGAGPRRHPPAAARDP